MEGGTRSVEAVDESVHHGGGGGGGGGGGALRTLGVLLSAGNIGPHEQQSTSYQRPTRQGSDKNRQERPHERYFLASLKSFLLLASLESCKYAKSFIRLATIMIRHKQCCDHPSSLKMMLTRFYSACLLGALMMKTSHAFMRYIPPKKQRRISMANLWNKNTAAKASYSRDCARLNLFGGSDPSAMVDTVNTIVSSPAVTTDLAATSAQMIQDSAEVAKNTLLASIVSKTVGVVVGNVIAGIILKSISDFFFKKTVEVKESIEAKIFRPAIPTSAYLKLLLCLFIDLVGDSSFILPGVGELEDVAWAPISAFLLSQLFGSNTVSSLEFAKEILPGTDILPLATISWLLQNVFVDNPLTDVLGLKKKQEEEAEKAEKDKENR